MRRQYDFRKGKRGAVLRAPRGTTKITIRIDDHVLAWLRQQVNAAGGGDYQTLINIALREHIARRRESLEKTVRRVLKEELGEVVGDAFSRGRSYEQARQRFLADMKNPRDLGTGGKITWTRDELHERHPAKKKAPTE